MRLTLLTALGLGIGNFIYQWAVDQNWILALYVTWFQAVACLAMHISNLIYKQK